MRYLLDANSIIHLLSGAFPAMTARVADTDSGAIGVSSIAFAEVAHGTANGKPPELRFLNAFLKQIPLVPFDEAAARAYASLPFRRHSYDRLIAAQAISLGLIVISRNIKDLAEIPGLRVENWTS